MHRDAEDPLHGAEDLADYLLAPVGSVLRDDNGLPDFCNESTPEDYYYAPTGLIIHAKTPLLIRRQSKSPPSNVTESLFIYLFSRNALYFCYWKTICSNLADQPCEYISKFNFSFKRRGDAGGRPEVCFVKPVTSDSD